MGSIDNCDTHMNGIRSAHLHPPLHVMTMRYRALAVKLAGTFLEQGPSAVVDLLCRGWESLEAFSEALDTTFPGMHHALNVKQPSAHSLLIMDCIFAITQRKRSMLAAGQRKFLIDHDMDICRFIEAVPDEEEWEQLMVQLGWGNPIPMNELIG